VFHLQQLLYGFARALFYDGNVKEVYEFKIQISSACMRAQEKCRVGHNKHLLKNWFSIFIKVFKPNRTFCGFCFKIRWTKPKFRSAIDNENKNFLNLSKERRQQNRHKN